MCVEQEKAEAATSRALRTLSAPLQKQIRPDTEKVDVKSDSAIAAALAEQAAAVVPTATSAQGPRARVTQSIDQDYDDAPSQTGLRLEKLHPRYHQLDGCAFRMHSLSACLA